MNGQWLCLLLAPGKPGTDGMFSDISPYAQTGTTDLKFTGMNQDTAANLYDFPAREYASTQGRWPSPDPAGLAAVDPTNPQSRNLYIGRHNIWWLSGRNRRNCYRYATQPLTVKCKRDSSLRGFYSLRLRTGLLALHIDRHF
jgi:RHS repeat-associated protein